MKEAISASWRGIVGPDPKTDNFGISFQIGEKGVLRLELTRLSVEQLVNALTHWLLPTEERRRQLIDPVSGYAAYLAARNSHSDKSSGSPSVDVSTPLEGE